jgi:hypothetical protein
MTLSDYWAPGPSSPGFDLTYVFLYRVSCTRVSLGMGSVQLLGIWVPVIVSFTFMSCS